MTVKSRFYIFLFSKVNDEIFQFKDLTFLKMCLNNHANKYLLIFFLVLSSILNVLMPIDNIFLNLLISYHECNHTCNLVFLLEQS